MSFSAVSWTLTSGAAMKRSTQITAASSWRACAANFRHLPGSAAGRPAAPGEADDGGETTHPPQDQKSAVLLGRYCWKRCDRLWA